MTLSFILKNGTGTGPTPIHLRLSHKGTRRYISLGLKVRPKRWSPAKGRARPSCPSRHEMNDYLQRMQDRAETAVRKLKMEPGRLDIDEAKAAVKDALSPTSAPRQEKGFLAFAREALGRYARRGQHGTHKSYQSTLNKFEDFLQEKTLEEETLQERGASTLAFEALTPQLLRDFRTYCYEKRGNSPNTVGRALKVLRNFTRKAIEAGHLGRDDYPFRHIEFDGEEVDKDVLTPGEIEALAEVDLNPGSELAEHRRWFLFAYYAAGMRFSDVATLRPKHFRGGRIYYRMEKESKSVGVPVTEKAQAILDYYDEIPATEEGWVFPVLEGYAHRNGKVLHTRKETLNRRCNRSLKEIGEQAGIRTKPTFHLARNAALWRLYKKTNDIYMVSKIAGHASVDQTQRYIDAFEDDSYDEVVRDAL